MSRKGPPVAVVGAGLAGLVAACALHRRGIPVVVYEAGRQVAGLARSFRDAEGFTHDFGAHFITNRLAAALGLGHRCRDVCRYGETVWLGGRSYTYPFGLLRTPRYLFGAISGKLKRRSAIPPESAAEWYHREYGTRLAEEVAIPLVESWSGAPATALAPSVIPPQVDRGTSHVLGLKLASRFTGRAVANGYSREKPENPHVWHVYPEGGVGALCEQLAQELNGQIRLETPIQAILVEDGCAKGVVAAGQNHEASAVLSTAPVHVLARLVKGTTALDNLANFRYRPMVLINLRLRGRGLLPDVVTWMPERDLPFFRITEAPQSMPWLAPEGKTMLTVDIGCEVGDHIWTMTDEALGQLCLRGLESVVPGIRDRFLGCIVLRTPVAHPVFLNEYEDQRLALERGLPVAGLYSIGRNGEFAHILMEDVYWRTLKKVHQIVKTLEQ